LTEKGFSVVRPEYQVNKAVSDGAISYYVDHFVQTRVSKFTYGSWSRTHYDPNNPEHQKRPIDTSTPGIKRINEVFGVILSGNQQVPETNEVRRSHVLRFTSLACLLSSVKLDIYCYRGIVVNTAFMDTNPDLYTKLCTVEVDLSHLRNTSEVDYDVRSSGMHYVIRFDLVMLFGGTEIEAQICWKENGVEKRSPTKLIYADDLPMESDEPLSPVTASTGASLSSLPGATLTPSSTSRSTSKSSPKETNTDDKS